MGLSPENKVDAAQGMSDIVPDKCGRRATRDPEHCRGTTSQSDFPTIQVSSYVKHPSNTLKLSDTSVYVPSHHEVQIHGGNTFAIFKKKHLDL